MLISRCRGAAALASLACVLLNFPADAAERTQLACTLRFPDQVSPTRLRIEYTATEIVLDYAPGHENISEPHIFSTAGFDSRLPVMTPELERMRRLRGAHIGPPPPERRQFQTTTTHDVTFGYEWTNGRRQWWVLARRSGSFTAYVDDQVIARGQCIFGS